MNTQQQSELKVFPREQPDEKNGRDKSLGSEFKLRRNSNIVTNKHHQQRRLIQVKLFEETVQKQNLSIKSRVYN